MKMKGGDGPWALFFVFWDVTWNGPELAISGKTQGSYLHFSLHSSHPSPAASRVYGRNNHDVNDFITMADIYRVFFNLRKSALFELAHWIFTIVWDNNSYHQSCEIKITIINPETYSYCLLYVCFRYCTECFTCEIFLVPCHNLEKYYPSRI